MASSLRSINGHTTRPARGGDTAGNQHTQRLNILCLAPYAVVPPRYGGPLRVYNLCRELGREFNVVQFAQQTQRNAVGVGLAPVRRQVTATYRELSSRNLGSLALYALTSLAWQCPPIWQSRWLALSAPAWLRACIQSADIIHVEHPWQFAWAYHAAGGRKPVTVAAHNVEAALYTAERIKAPPALARYIAGAIAGQEALAVTEASRIFATSEADVHEFGRRYGCPPERFTVVPNGVDTAFFTPAGMAMRRQRKHELGLPLDRPVVIFAASQHPPNVDAARQIIAMASRWDAHAVHFAIVGTVGRALPGMERHNLTISGPVEQTRPYFEAADIAINPMLTGSGTNLKQLEYMAMGLPTIATPVGARGIPVVDGFNGLVCPIDDFPNALRSLIDRPEQQRAIGDAGRTLVEQQFSWNTIGAVMRAALRTVCGPTTL